MYCAVHPLEQVTLEALGGRGAGLGDEPPVWQSEGAHGHDSPQPPPLYHWPLGVMSGP